jgi:hypothetical protein
MTVIKETIEETEKKRELRRSQPKKKKLRR